MTFRLVAVEVAPVWRTSTGSARDDRMTDALADEPLVATGAESDGRVQVVVPWQPSSRDPRGYPGWVDAVLLGPGVDETPLLGVPEGVFPPGLDDAVDVARTLLGTPYVWGGMSRHGIDCSGLVHLAHRALGTVVPRDARDQAAGLPAVPQDDVRRGDLYFFARPYAPVHQVALVVEPGLMLHASDRDGGVVEAPLRSSGRSSTLVSAGRVVARPTMTR